MITKERQEIFTDTDGFNQAQSRFNRKKQIEIDIRKEVKRLIKRVPNKDFYKDIETNFYSMVKSAFKDSNPMNLSGRKLVQLMEIKMNKLMQLANEYLNCKDAIEPSLPQFTTYAESDEELMRYNTCMKVIDACKELDEIVKVYPHGIQQASSNAIRYDRYKNKLVVNHHWIKGKNF